MDKPSSLGLYTPDDEPTPQGADRRRLLESRAKSTETFGRQRLAIVQGSDAHTLTAFATRSPAKPWTRFKMNELSFEAFRTALIDPEARVRAVAQVPKSIPRVRGMYCSGGFLDGEIFHFSDNLNCFIGGRGTGKSSAIRSLAYGLGAHDGFGEFEHCPDTVVVYCEDDSGVMYRYERSRGGDVIVKAKEDGAIADVPADAFRIEYYGQGELADVAKDPLSNPALFQGFLDRHIHLRDLLDQEDALANRLRENAAQLLPVEAEFAQLPARQQTLADINKKLRVAEEGNLREIVGIQARLAAEKALLASLDSLAQVYRQGLSLWPVKRDPGELCRTAGELTGDAVSKEVIEGLCERVKETNAFADGKEAELNTRLREAAKDIAALLARLKANHGRMESEIAVKLAELRAKGLAGNLGELQTLLRQRTVVTQGIAQIEQRRAHLDALRGTRDALLVEVAAVREKMTERRKEQLKVINANLTKTITDYTVIVKYEPAGIIDQVLRHVSEVMRGSYFSDQQCRDLCRKLTPQELAAYVRAGDITGLATAAGISSEWAAEIRNRFSSLKNVFELQALAKQPCPVIVVKTKGNPPREVPVVQLSDGQRHTILLTIALLAESNLPLVIDQPEDYLDSGFIFSSIVATLRAIKERRQVILVTHNPNIAVLGDSELLFPMHRVSDQGKAVSRGSIDRAETRDAAQKILEGGEVAFKRRQAIYGY